MQMSFEAHLIPGDGDESCCRQAHVCIQIADCLGYRSPTHVVGLLHALQSVNSMEGIGVSKATLNLDRIDCGKLGPPLFFGC